MSYIHITFRDYLEYYRLMSEEQRMTTPVFIKTDNDFELCDPKVLEFMLSCTQHDEKSLNVEFIFPDSIMPDLPPLN